MAAISNSNFENIRQNLNQYLINDASALPTYSGWGAQSSNNPNLKFQDYFKANKDGISNYIYDDQKSFESQNFLTNNGWTDLEQSWKDDKTGNVYRTYIDNNGMLASVPAAFKINTSNTQSAADQAIDAYQNGTSRGAATSNNTTSSNNTTPSENTPSGSTSSEETSPISSDVDGNIFSDDYDYSSVSDDVARQHQGTVYQDNQGSTSDYSEVDTSSPSGGESEVKRKFTPDYKHVYDWANTMLNLGMAKRNSYLAKPTAHLINTPYEYGIVTDPIYLQDQARNNQALALSTASRMQTADANTNNAYMMQAVAQGNDMYNQAAIQRNQLIDQQKQADQERMNRNSSAGVELSNINSGAINLAGQQWNYAQQQLNNKKGSQLSKLMTTHQYDYERNLVDANKKQDTYDTTMYLANAHEIHRNEISDPNVRSIIDTYVTNEKLGVQLLSELQQKDPVKFQQATAYITSLDFKGKTDYFKRLGVQVANFDDQYASNQNNSAATSTVGTARQGGVLQAKDGTKLQIALLKKKAKDLDRVIKQLQKSEEERHKDTRQGVAMMNRTPRKYDWGGLLTYDVDYARVPDEWVPPTFGDPSAAKAAKKDQSAGDKSLLSTLKDIDGLPADTTKIAQMISALDTSDPSDPLGVISGKTGVAKMTQIYKAISDAKTYKKEYEEAVKHLQGNGGIGEPCINSTGQVLVQDSEKGFQWVSPKEIGGKRIITYSEILEARQKNENFAFNSNFLSVAAAGVGMKSIETHLASSLSKLGHNETSEAYMGKVSAEGMQGNIAKLAQFIGTPKYEKDKNGNDVQVGFNDLIEGLFKGTYSNDSNAEQARAAMNWMWQTLTPSEASLLMVKGGGSLEGGWNLLAQAFAAATSISIKHDISGHQDHAREAKIKEKEFDDDINAAQRAMAGLESEPERKRIQIGASLKEDGSGLNGGSGMFDMEFSIYRTGIYQGNSKKAPKNLTEFLETDSGTFFDTAHLSAGQTGISPQYSNLITLTTPGQMEWTYLPYTYDENTGKQVPDMNMLMELQKIFEDVRKENPSIKAKDLLQVVSKDMQGELSGEEKNLYKNLLSNTKLVSLLNSQNNSDKIFDESLFCKFGMLDACVPDVAFGDSKKPKFGGRNPIDVEDEKAYPWIHRIYGDSDKAQDLIKSAGIENLYEVRLYIPAKGVGAFTGTADSKKASLTYAEVARRQQQIRERRARSRATNEKVSNS